MIDYEPKDAEKCWEKGRYNAVLRNVEDGQSKAGSPMQTWTWEVHHPDGRVQHIKDYVTVPACTWKIKQLAEAAGRRDQFDQRQFQPEDVMDCNFAVELRVESQDGYPDKNRVQGVYEYKPQPRVAVIPRSGVERFPVKGSMRPTPQPVSSPISQEQQFKDEDIPFNSAR